MNKTELTIKIDEKIYDLLCKNSRAENTTPEALASEIVEKAIKISKKAAGPTLPSVALIKGRNSVETTAPEVSLEKNISRSMLTSPLSTIDATPALSQEKLQRKSEIEERMRELSLLIETAEPEKTEGYSLQYAMLAAELEAIA